MNEKQLIRKAMSALGSRSSAVKTEAARRNGAKGAQIRWGGPKKRTPKPRIGVKS